MRSQRLVIRIILTYLLNDLVLAGDKTHTPEILIHALDEMEKIDKKLTTLLYYQPTVPFRKFKHIDDPIEKFLKSSFDSLIIKNKTTSWWMFQLKDDKLVTVLSLKKS